MKKSPYDWMTLKEWKLYIANRVWFFRKRAKMTQRYLSMLARFPTRLIERIENENYSPNMDELRMISEALEIEVSEFDPTRKSGPYTPIQPLNPSRLIRTKAMDEFE